MCLKRVILSTVVNPCAAPQRVQFCAQTALSPAHLALPVGCPGTAEGLCSLPWGLKSTLTEAASDFSCGVTSGGWEGILFQAVIGFQATMRLSVFLNSSVTSVLLSFSYISAVLVLCSGLRGKPVWFSHFFLLQDGAVRWHFCFTWYGAVMSRDK